MAWQATRAWKSPPVNQPKDDSSFPGLKPTSPEATNKIEYEELQQNELLALEAIYGEDFVQHSSTHSAWQKAEPCFDIRIKAPTDEDFAITIGFVLNATYPKTPPIITIKEQGFLRESTQFKIQKFIETQPKVFAKDEQEMVDQIVEGIREILEEAAQAKVAGKNLPSLEEERERHEADAAKAAQRQKEEEDRKQKEVTKEEERVIAEMLQQQLDRQRQKAKESRQSRRPNGASQLPSAPTTEALDDRIDFDQFCNSVDKSGNQIIFRSVTAKCDERHGKVSAVYTVRPVVPSGVCNQTLALKEATLKSSGKESQDFRKQLQSLESRLQDLKTTKRIVHRQIVEILDFKVQGGMPSDPSASNAWTVRILMPLAEKGPLEELLELAGNLEVSKVKSWTRDLLDALNYLHNKNIAHQCIHAGNILLFRESTGEIVPKIADGWYQREIHTLCEQKQGPPGVNSAKSAYWLPPEIAAASKPVYTFKTDIWDFGIVFVQMIFGLDILRKYSSPKNLMESLFLSQPLQELVGRFFKEDKQKRPRAFELGSSEFLATDAPVLFDDSSAVISSVPSLTSLQAPPMRLRRDSHNRGAAISRYTEDFVEEGRLGKGGFGEVVKARKKLDGQIYAIKKITQRSHTSLTEILKEVRLLSQLSHPAVVRYYNTWVEEVADFTDTEGETSADDYTAETRETESNGLEIQFATSTGGLDFMSSNAHIEFEYSESSDEDGDEDETEGDDDSSASDDEDAHNPGSPVKARQAAQMRRARFQKPYRTILYISMEYCEKRTLRDLISRNLYQNTTEIWRLFRQVLEGLAHIHGLSIVHRDLKPENIFISSSADGIDNVKIGDFGLATSGQFSIDKAAAAGHLETDDMTRSIGTAYYSAPEVRSAAHGMYSTKVDMYSLGIIFFEMCYQPMMGMQKADVIGQLRRQKPILPKDFKAAEKSMTEIILSLVNHNPKERPYSAELLKSGKLPVQMESETIRRTLAGLADPNSPYYRKMLSTLFTHPVEATKDYAWDMFANAPTASELIIRHTVKAQLTSIFRRHGAVEATRGAIYPRSSQYGDNVVQLLDQNGTVLQLPYDLMMGHARMLAKNSSGPIVPKTFAFGSVFRDKQDTGQPQMFGEVDFDIVSTDALDLALKEAEVLKIIDEILVAFPSLSATPMSFYLGHSDLLQLIYEHCGIEPANRRATSDVLSRLNIHNFTWQKIRMELRSPAVGLSATSVDELQQFDFRDTPNKTFAKLKKLFEGTDIYQRASPTIAHLKEVAEYAKRFGVRTKIYISPLNSLKENFYNGGLMFSCLYTKKVRDVFAAGGRYDALIKEQRPKMGGNFDERHAVGFSIAWERLARIPKAGGKAFLKKGEDDSNSLASPKRCDILVASFDPAMLRSSGVELLQTLWALDISAELAKDSRSPEDLLQKHRDDNYSWIIILKPESMLKIKSLLRKDVADIDIPSTQLPAWLRTELHKRDTKGSGGSSSRKSIAAAQSEGTSGAAVEREREQDVKVLVAQTRSKKFNRRTVVEQAQVTAANLVTSFLDGPILAVETTEQVMALISGTRLSDPESWRRVDHSVTTTEKKYVRDVHDQLDAWRFAFDRNDGTRHSFLYNFRTGTCLYYDLAA
ncbi:Serine/threonine-protein kinase, GCN2 [Cordyceps fumosorosea ARSEF 2679]|uniref:non-specific serine/threonine protein kinase n=1 Tax=Cordyceps fumosorosea (strain ARSEF 2679) TaxID=1081104 RepID=A0A162LLU1_CORFA|nr:Serine/threonine-protein kinase, GCN2 [Cordyceps fumosorosea ARSEF 2679]OAA72524.1 Serine/threonine-protein kinase, GCN2 [Cordyceps fumosorosea ARSEF 2679]